jgi:hypothetical protein
MSCPLWGATYPRRVAQAWYRHWTDERRQVYGAKARTAVPGLEDVSAQSCRWHCGDGPVCRSDRVVPAALWAADHGPWPATNPLARRHRSSNGGMDRQPAHGSLWLGANPRHLIHDRDACYGQTFVRRVHSLGIRDHPTSPRSPCQNGYAERLIGSIRRECQRHGRIEGRPVLGGLYHQYVRI